MKEDTEHRPSPSSDIPIEKWDLGKQPDSRVKPAHDLSVIDDMSDTGQNWNARCTCGWSSQWCGSEEWAELYADQHRSET